MYYHLDKELYSKHISALLSEIHLISLDNKYRNFGETMYSILWQTLFFYLEDYALYLSFYEKFGLRANSGGVIHIGIKSVQNFASFWDHLGYGLSTVFHLDFTERETYFDPVVNELIKKDVEFSDVLREMKELYQVQSDLRNRFRHPITHRYHEYFIKRDESDSSSDKIQRINQVLELAYKNSMEAMKLYLLLIENFAPSTEYGSNLKTSIKKNNKI